MVHSNGTAQELAAAVLALACPLTEYYEFVQLVREWDVGLSAARDDGADHSQPVVEQIAHGLLWACID